MYLSHEEYFYMTEHIHSIFVYQFCFMISNSVTVMITEQKDLLDL